MVYGGVYRGTIAGGGLGGRIQVAFPWLDSDQFMYATVCSQPGIHARYQSGQAVFIMFEMGDVNRPVIIGAPEPGG
jgi:uncharacterized protein involved in type VI secretion and phage assembly